jgi:SAM-dependent methyltransferase
MKTFQKTGKPPYEDAAACLEHMCTDAERQLAKDRHFVRFISRYFISGPILEIGAGVGQLSLLLRTIGFNVIASDIQPWMIDYMLSRGLESQVVDCLDIIRSTSRTFPNILAQAPSPFVTSDLSVVRMAYRSVYDALINKGRFVFIFPDNRDASKCSQIREHWPIINETGFRLVKHFRNQIFPSRFYFWLPYSIYRVLESSCGMWFGLRNVIILEKR